MSTLAQFLAATSVNLINDIVDDIVDDYLPLAGGTVTGDIVAGAGGGELRDEVNVAAIDWNNRLLIDYSGNYSVDWGNRYMLDSSNQLALNWNTRTLQDTSSNDIYDWSTGRLEGDGTGLSGLLPLNGGLMDSGSAISWNTEGYQLYGTGIYGNTLAMNILDWVNCYAVNSTGDETINWQTNSLRRLAGGLMVDWEAGMLHDGSWMTSESVNWTGRTLRYDNYDQVDWANCLIFSAGIKKIDWLNSTLNDDNMVTLDWYQRILNDGVGSTVVDWSNNTGSGILFHAPVVLPTFGAMTIPTGTLGATCLVNDNDNTTGAVGAVYTGGNTSLAQVTYNGTDWIVTAWL